MVTSSNQPSTKVNKPAAKVKPLPKVPKLGDESVVIEKPVTPSTNGDETTTGVVKKPFEKPITSSKPRPKSLTFKQAQHLQSYITENYYSWSKAVKDKYLKKLEYWQITEFTIALPTTVKEYNQNCIMILGADKDEIYRDKILECVNYYLENLIKDD